MTTLPAPTTPAAPMTPENAPVGTIVRVGHPANGLTATKRPDGQWYTNHDGTILDLDPRDVTGVLAYTRADMAQAWDDARTLGEDRGAAQILTGQATRRPTNPYRAGR